MLQYDCISDIIIDIINNIIITGDLKNMKKVLSILLCLLMAVALCPFTALADATQEIPSSAIQISSVDDLAMICNEYPADGYYCLTCDIDMTDALGEYGDYYNDGKGWEPIGNKNTPFTGTFDGMGHTIKGLYINRTSEIVVGFFSYANGATIKNCKLEAEEIKGGMCAGGFVGYSSNLTVSNCAMLSGKITGAVSLQYVATANAFYSWSYLGGLIGYCSGTAKITDCTNKAAVSNTGSLLGSSYKCYSYSECGGIIGYADGTATVDNCTNSGDVTVNIMFIGSKNNKSNLGCFETGGIIGTSSKKTTINNCTNSGKVSATQNYYYFGQCYTGGIIGKGEDILVLTNCVNNAKVSTSDSSSSTHSCNSGGIVGIGESTLTVKNCVNNGDISAYTLSSSWSTYRSGGIVGRADSTMNITNCINNADVDARTYSSSYSLCYSGGIVGGYNGTTKSTIKSCANFDGGEYAICGDAGDNNLTVENCLNFSGVSNLSSGKIKNSYSICRYYSSITCKVWDSDGNSESKTEEEMSKQSTFGSFDFDSVWKMSDTTDFPYPVLAYMCSVVVSNKSEASAAIHTYDSGKITTAPAIGVAGVRTYTCTKCGATKTETIAAKMLSDGIIVTVNAFTADEFTNDSNGIYVSTASGEKVASNAPLATGMKLVLENGSEKQERQIAVLGDVDCDGTISVNDARSALRAAVKLDVLTGVHLVAAKVMGGSEVTVSDARLILRAAVKLENGKDWINNIK